MYTNIMDTVDVYVFILGQPTLSSRVYPHNYYEQ